MEIKIYNNKKFGCTQIMSSAMDITCPLIGNLITSENQEEQEETIKNMLRSRGHNFTVIRIKDVKVSPIEDVIVVEGIR